MKAAINFLAESVRRMPWAVLAAIIVITLVLGPLSTRFQPEQDNNDSFAPNAPELAAADRISELFAADASQSVLQIVFSSEDGNLFSRDGLEAVETVTETVSRGAVSDRLQGGGFISFMRPALMELEEGAPRPATDGEVEALYRRAVEETAGPQRDFMLGMLPEDADPLLPYADKGLMLVGLRGEEADSDEFDAFVDRMSEAADQIRGADLPAGVRAEPFSFELLFGDTGEFQAELGRLFGTAAMIIVLVLTLVFLIKPSRKGPRRLMAGTIAAVVAALALVILPTLGIVLDSVFPDAVKNLDSNLFFSIAGLILAAGFLAWTFTDRGLRRSTADTLLTLITIFFAIAWMNGIGYLLFGGASPMTQILPILLIGLGVDYSIHVTSRYREELSSGATVDASIGTAIRTVGVALVLATVTTAVGFLTNATSSIPALREFGVLAAVGIVSSFVLMLTFVPAMRELLDRRGRRRGTLEPHNLKTGESRLLGRLAGSASVIANRAAALAAGVALLLGGLGAWGWANLEAKFSFLDFIPVTSPLRTTFESLLADFGGGFGEETQVLVEGDAAQPRAWNAMAAANRNLADTDNVVAFGGSVSGTSPVNAVAQLGGTGPMGDESVRLALEEQGFDFQTLRFPEGADVRAVYDAAWEAAPEEMSAVLHRTGGEYDAALFSFTTQAGESQAGRMRTNLTADFAPVAAVGLSAVPTSAGIINDVVVTTLQNSQVWSLILTLAAALALLVINFWFEARRPLLGVVTTLPVILVVLWSFGLMAAFGIPFGPVTATIAAMAIGFGIPYMIHITHRFLEDRGRAANDADAIRSTLTHTGGALFGSALTTIAGFGILVTSTTIPFRQFGFVTAYTIALAMLAAILVLPSMLRLWARLHDRRQRKSATAPSGERSPAAEPGPG